MSKKTYQWAVIGAGGAGIAAVGQLLDQQVPPEDIIWLDPYFQAGDLGQYWKHIDGNTAVKTFTDFLTAAQSFQYDKASKAFSLNQLPSNETCELKHMAQPLLWVTKELRKKVFSVQATVHHIKLFERKWHLQSNEQTYEAKQVILAHGAIPDTLNYPDISTLPFHVAIDKHQLAKHLNPEDSFAVFGSSHSAIMIIKHLVELKAKRIINFYRSPCRYAIELDDWTLFDNTGLKGKTAQWARAHIDGQLPANIERYPADESHVSRYLPDCQQLIAAVGFSRRNTIVIDGYEQAQYNPFNGIIAPGLFGLGIAYPNASYDRLGYLEYQVGLWKFMAYLKHILPIWLSYPA